MSMAIPTASNFGSTYLYCRYSISATIVGPNMNERIPELLENSKRIAIVGLSDKAWRTSYQIAETLQAYGYTILPVNPSLDSWKGIPAYDDLLSVPTPIDIVNVFRRSEHVCAIVDEAIAVGARAIWTQLAVVDIAAGERAEANGLHVIMDRCIAIELSRFRATP
jgi:predicted CoA-binding protein